MSDACKYYQFLSNKAAIELLRHAKDGIMGPESLPQLSKKQYYDKMQRARRLGLVFKKPDGRYYLTAFGEMLVEKVQIIADLKPIEWQFKAIDAQKDEEIRLLLIHQLFSWDPEIENILTKSTRRESPRLVSRGGAPDTSPDSSV